MASRVALGDWQPHGGADGGMGLGIGGSKGRGRTARKKQIGGERGEEYIRDRM